MAATSLATWERFYERVVVRGGNWPRALWFAAVEDGLKGALSEDSRLLAEYRRHIAEWQQLEGAAAGTHRDAQRLAQLEADIMRLIGYANQVVRESAPDPSGQAGPGAAPPMPPPARSGLWLSAMTIGVMLFCGVVLGATYFQNQRMTQQTERDLADLQRRLSEQAGDRSAALEARIRSVERVKQDVEGLQAELRDNVTEFSQVMSESVRSITALSDKAAGDPARQLAGVDADVGGALRQLRARSAAIERGLDQIERRLARSTRRLPGLDGGVSQLAEQIEATGADFERVARQVEKIKAQAPEIALWLEGQRNGLAQTLEGQRQSVKELDVEIATLKGVLNESRGQLQGFQNDLEQDVAQAREQDQALAQALGQMRATQLKAAELASQIEARAASAQSKLEARVETILSDLAAAAERAVAHSEELTSRAGADATRRLDAASEQAIAGLLAAGERYLAELSQAAIATRTELDQTRAGLVAGWRGMDEAVAERHAEVLADLERHAGTLEGRVQELLDALDVIVARANNG
jgi:chromosome segregation ATPase